MAGTAPITWNWTDPTANPLGGATPTTPITWNTDTTNATNGLLGLGSGSDLSGILNALSGLSGLGGQLSAQGAGNANSQIAQAQLQSGANAQALQEYALQQAAQNAAGQLDLQRQAFTDQNRSATARQALVGALLSGGMTPTSVGPGGASGGILRSLNGNPQALQALQTLGRQGAQAQQTPVTFQGGQILTPPTLAPVPQITNSATSTGGGLLSDIAGIASAMAPFLSFL